VTQSTAMGVVNNSPRISRFKQFLENCQNSVLDHADDPVKSSTKLDRQPKRPEGARPRLVGNTLYTIS